MKPTVRHGNRWKGGRTIDSNGYVLVRVGKQHHLAHCTGYAYEHRVIAEKTLGRRLRKGEVVHHKKQGKEHRRNNLPKNLEVKKNDSEHHALYHRPHGCVRRFPWERNPIIKCLCGCGSLLSRFDARGRPRFYLPHHLSKSFRAKSTLTNWLKKRGQA